MFASSVYNFILIPDVDATTVLVKVRSTTYKGRLTHVWLITSCEWGNIAEYTNKTRNMNLGISKAKISPSSQGGNMNVGKHFLR